MVQEETLGRMLEEHCQANTDIWLAYIGHSGNGAVVARYKAIDASISRMGMHSAEVWRACRRLHSVLPDKTESIQFTSTSKTERIVAQKIASTPYYLAFVIAARASSQETSLVYKQVMRAVQSLVSEL